MILKLCLHAGVLHNFLITKEQTHLSIFSLWTYIPQHRFWTFTINLLNILFPQRAVWLGRMIICSSVFQYQFTKKKIFSLFMYWFCNCIYKVSQWTDLLAHFPQEFHNLIINQGYSFRLWHWPAMASAPITISSYLLRSRSLQQCFFFFFLLQTMFGKK